MRRRRRTGVPARRRGPLCATFVLGSTAPGRSPSSPRSRKRRRPPVCCGPTSIRSPSPAPTPPTAPPPQRADRSAVLSGTVAYLTNIRAVVDLPLLRKDFILDHYQLLEARFAGADAVLLIAEILDDRCCRSCCARRRGWACSAGGAVRSDQSAPRAHAGARLIGVNNRDLRTFVTRLEQTLEIAPLVPPGVCLVSESGIRSRRRRGPARGRRRPAPSSSAKR